MMTLEQWQGSRIADLEADNAQLRHEAAEWTEMLARDGIRFEEQHPAMETYQVTGTDQYGRRVSFVAHVPDPVPPLYFWLGKDAPA